jgi:MYXO-CTERM domain-containing protein
MGCPYPQICENGACIEDPCFEYDCGPGHICDHGTCVEDPCNTMHCPEGATCHRGVCGEDGEVPEGGGGLQNADGGLGGNNSGVGSGDPGRYLAGDGCACRASGGAGDVVFLLPLLGLGGIIRRRRR